MKISAVIAEYNPFHLGHALHLKKTREQGCDKIIVILSGNFTQRGEAAIFDKFTGPPALCVLGQTSCWNCPHSSPFPPAEGFADGAVRILDALGCVDALSFGSEIDDLDALRGTAALLAQESPMYQVYLQEQLSAGKSFPAAREKAFTLAYGEQAAAPLRSPTPF